MTDRTSIPDDRTAGRTLPSLTHWIAGGKAVQVGPHTLFVRRDGPPDGLPVTLVHGFPTSSHDWAAVVPELAASGCCVTTLDLLGFGESDKPRRHRYSLLEQADLVEGVWGRLGIRDTALAAHDYGVSVAQELLARNPARITRMAWLNGGLYADLHRPLLIQRMLRGPLGPLLSHATNERLFTASMRRILGRRIPSADLHDMWTTLSRSGGHRLAPRLLRYMDERREHAARWTAALEGFSGPTLFVWGPADPVSGAHVLPRIRQRLPHATVTELTGPPPVGHYPQVEAPQEVAAALVDFLTG